jgi:hypothetical protein
MLAIAVCIFRNRCPMLTSCGHGGPRSQWAAIIFSKTINYLHSCQLEFVISEQSEKGTLKKDKYLFLNTISTPAVESYFIPTGAAKV